MSSILTCSANASVEIYQGRLKPCIDILGKSNVPLQHLVREAEQIIKESFAPDSRSTYTDKNDHDEVSVQLDKVMLAMLSHAEECGGERGQRYIASAIVACSKQDEMVGALEALGTTWLTHLLFIFKTGDEEHLSEKRQKSFTEDVMSRDGYTCVLTGYIDHSHPRPDPAKSTFMFELDAAHILRRAIGSFSNDPNSPSFKSAEVTFDILVNFTHLSREVLEELGSNLDDPSNGIALERNAHKGFDNFHWCMKKTEVGFLTLGLLRRADYVFRRRMNMRSKSSIEEAYFDFLKTIAFLLKTTAMIFRRTLLAKDNVLWSSRTLDRYIALHSAIAEILNTSNAGRFFDELLKRYKEDRGRVPAVRSWSEFESLLEEEMLRESVTSMFQLANVH